MPKKVVTKQSSSSSMDMATGFRNFCNAIAESIGGTATVNTSSTPYSASIPMSSVGYPELTIKIDQYSSPERNIKITMNNSETGMNFVIHQNSYGWELYDNQNRPLYNAYTAICARDSNNDSVVIAITSGTDPTSSDAYVTGGRPPLILFAGKDVKENVLFGGGVGGSVNCLCCGTTTSSINVDSNRVSSDFENILHLTKMVNYLADGYPEMKSAYISITRPYVDTPGKGFKNQSYYSEGALWFIAGDSTSDRWYPPYNPVVKY